MPQFFINNDNIKENKIFITNNSDIIHIKNVLRFAKKDKLILAGKDNFIYEAEIQNIKPDVTETNIIEKYYSDKKLNINITLAQSVIKSQKQDYLVQKATELGVRTIIPFISQNTVVKFNSENDKLHKINRWQKIVYESSKQCKRGDLAEVKQVSSIDGVVKLTGFDLKILCSEKNDSFSIKNFLNQKKHKKVADILVVIGPEGGWSDFEIKKFIENDFTEVTLGKLVYRAETAACAVISHIIYEYEL